MSPDARLIERLCAMRPEITNIIGFHDLIDHGDAPDALAAMTYQVHLTAAAVKLAVDVYTPLIEDAMEDRL